MKCGTYGDSPRTMRTAASPEGTPRWICWPNTVNWRAR
ncbi:Uncharacterised protein [Bordetella pertussis]|nr:Uncharacterised protein [Bordetella pertussis]CFW35373.1 Uncharacterised protein [Bordetella pertussis]